MDPDFERFSVYGFSIDYPKEARIEFNPKSRRGEGDVVFHFPDKTKIFLSWGDLEKAKKSFGTVGEHADHGLNKVKTARNIKSFELISHDTVSINSHQGAYNRAKFEEVAVGFLGGRSKSPREAHSIHVHCAESSRYYVVYALLFIGGTYDYAKAFTKMAKTLKCH
ncbi:MAG: hypothetical protein ABSC50_00140 [Candidatus Bathyarchaeia archaeon]|jgi:hypothetical protein